MISDFFKSKETITFLESKEKLIDLISLYKDTQKDIIEIKNRWQKISERWQEYYARLKKRIEKEKKEKPDLDRLVILMEVVLRVSKLLSSYEESYIDAFQRETDIEFVIKMLEENYENMSTSSTKTSLA